MQSPPNLLCFEDAAVERLAPATTARPAYAISCASFRLIDWLKQLELAIFAECRPHLRVVQQFDFAIAHPQAASLGGSPLLLVNARLVPTVRLFRTLRNVVESAEPVVIRDRDGAVAIALISEPPTSALSSNDLLAPISTIIDELAASLPTSKIVAETFKWPHDIVHHHMRNMCESMQWRIDKGAYTQQQDGVFVAPGASIGQYAVIDTSKGPIVLEENVHVGPFCYLSGPVHIGARSRVIEHSALKDAVALGHTTKVGGEVEASVIEPFSNKQHHGFLGHSYLGSWINLGAGTCNSDLKNTYGTINIDYGSEKVPTDMQFMGCVMGDYSKTAINTGIFTGKIVGVCSMLYGFVTSNVPSFVNYARLFGQTATLPPEVMISTQARMFARRKVEQRECDRQLIFDMFELTEEERNLQAAIGL
jgi:UDP-N-acetylglucosamine diphosphorylase / glucose-1-phosphate thymidylyltransferase / UDP-N-acetylgalactosamine diphosphorylase / glucosamine-1-phosphate N-acetyltransferase / galactosamine-1-phosphate N-acetyltransferase